MALVFPNGQPDFMNSHIHKFMRSAIGQMIALLMAKGSAPENRQPYFFSVEVEAMQAGVGDVPTLEIRYRQLVAGYRLSVVSWFEGHPGAVHMFLAIRRKFFGTTGDLGGQPRIIHPRRDGQF